MNNKPSRGTGDDYGLKVDEQAQKFLELNHTLTFFLVTASVGSLGFTLTYAKEKTVGGQPGVLALLLIAAAALLALFSAWSGLRALVHDQASFRLHLKYRYQGHTWDQLTSLQQGEWDAVNQNAASARRRALSCLLTTVVAQVVYLFLLLASQGDLPMHHYGEDSTDVAIIKEGYRLHFRNKVSGAEITMEVPAVGALEDPMKRLEPEAARALADEVAHLLRRVLE